MRIIKPIFFIACLLTTPLLQAAPDQRLLNIQTLLDTEQLTQAEAALKALPESVADSIPVMNLRGQLAAKRGQFQQASRWFERIIANTPEAQAAFHNLQMLYQHQAAQVYQQALETPAEDAPTLRLQASPSLELKTQRNAQHSNEETHPPKQQAAQNPHPESPSQAIGDIRPMASEIPQSDALAAPAQLSALRPAIYEVRKAQLPQSKQRREDIEILPAKMVSDPISAEEREMMDMLMTNENTLDTAAASAHTVAPNTTTP